MLPFMPSMASPVMVESQEQGPARGPVVASVEEEQGSAHSSMAASVVWGRVRVSSTSGGGSGSEERGRG